MSELQMKINHLTQLKRTTATLQRRIDVLQKEVDRELSKKMCKEYAAVNAK